MDISHLWSRRMFVVVKNRVAHAVIDVFRLVIHLQCKIVRFNKIDGFRIENKTMIK